MDKYETIFHQSMQYKLQNIISNNTEVVIGKDLAYKKQKNKLPTNYSSLKFGRVLSPAKLFYAPNTKYDISAYLNIPISYNCDIVSFNFDINQYTTRKLIVGWENLIPVNHNMFKLLGL